MRAKLSWRRQGDIDVLHLGEIPVGRIHPSARSWIFNLRYPACFWKGEKSEEIARCNLLNALSAWLKAAGLDEPEQGDLFSAGADGETA